MNLLDMPDINLTLFYFFNNLAGRSPVLDWFVVFLTSYASYVVCIIVALYVVLVVPFRIPLGTARFVKLWQATEMILSVFTTWYVVKIIKVLLALPRPFETLTNIRVLLSISGGDSFPSGHAALTSALATTVFFYHRRLGLLLYLFAITISLSRLYVGVHYPVDIAAGFLIGILIPILFHALFQGKWVEKAGGLSALQDK
jgi:undecaprenyl-diphosphatase